MTMKATYLISGICAGASVLVTNLTAEAQAAPAAYETPAVLSAATLLKPEHMRGPYHEILDPVPTAGFSNQYTVRTNWGTHTVLGNDLLTQRLRELRAIAELEQASKSKEFEKALLTAAAKPFHMVGNTLQDPVGTAKNVGSGAMRFIKRAGEITTRGGKRSANTDNAAKSFIGFSKQKREIAYRLKVDPYTDNPVLQKHLDDMAWASFGGGFVIRAGTFAVGGATGAVVGGLSTIDDVAKAIRDNTPADLSAMNRAALDKMGISEATTKAFVEHPAISPSMQTIITTRLGKLGEAGGREDFLKMVITSRNATDVHFFQRVAEMMEVYHVKVSPVRQVLNLYGLPAIHATNDALVVPISVDYGWWTEQTDRFSAAVASYKPSVKIGKRILYVSGTVSPRAKEELTKRGFIVTDNVRASLYR
jgi:hypothetical protein